MQGGTRGEGEGGDTTVGEAEREKRDRGQGRGGRKGKKGGCRERGDAGRGSLALYDDGRRVRYAMASRAAVVDDEGGARVLTKVDGETQQSSAQTGSDVGDGDEKVAR